MVVPRLEQRRHHVAHKITLQEILPFRDLYSTLLAPYVEVVHVNLRFQECLNCGRVKLHFHRKAS